MIYSNINNSNTSSILRHEILLSTELIFRSRLTWLLIFGPIALIGKTTPGILLFGESGCFILAGLTLIPLAERLSFVTEEVASHTSQTIGALLNATFGNLPELLISASAIQQGYYRVIQLTLLGSILTNLLFVFGLSCLLGGLRYQVQKLRIVSGNASIGMLMMAVAGLALPAALMLSDEMKHQGEAEKRFADKNGDGVSDINDGPTFAMVGFSRFNAIIMISGYLLYLLFQLGSHKDEFDDLQEEEEEDNDDDEDDEEEELSSRHPTIIKTKKKIQANIFCRRWIKVCRGGGGGRGDGGAIYKSLKNSPPRRDIELHNFGSTRSIGQQQSSIPQSINDDHQSNNGMLTNITTPTNNGRRKNKSKGSDEEEPYTLSMTMSTIGENNEEETHMSFRAGLLWLFLITLSISAMSDILVETIDDFALRMRISEVFTSLVILPFFSNIAEQVSALIFAYRNEMDLCVGITVGSAVQIALFVLPGTVLIGWAMDRSMNLFFRGFETCCLIFSVVSVAAVLQGGTTNWLVGCYLLGVYFMVAAGFWFHELESLTVDGELHHPHNNTIFES